MYKIEKKFLNSKEKVKSQDKAEKKVESLFNIKIKRYQCSVSASHHKILSYLEKNKTYLKEFKAFDDEPMDGICYVLCNFVTAYDLLNNREKYEEFFYNMFSVTREKRREKLKTLLNLLHDNLEFFYSDTLTLKEGIEYPTEVHICDSKIQNNLIEYVDKEYFLLNNMVFRKYINTVPANHYINISFFFTDGCGHVITIRKSENDCYSLYDSNFGALFDIKDVMISEIVEQIVAQYNRDCSMVYGTTLNCISAKRRTTLLDSIIVEDNTIFLHSVIKNRDKKLSNENNTIDISKTDADNNTSLSECNVLEVDKNNQTYCTIS